MKFSRILLLTIIAFSLNHVYAQDQKNEVKKDGEKVEKSLEEKEEKKELKKTKKHHKKNKEMKEMKEEKKEEAKK